MKHTFYNFLKRMKLIYFFIFFKEISFYKSEFIQIISIIKSEIPTLPPHLPKSYKFCILCRHCLHCFSNFSDSHFEYIMVNSRRLSIDTNYFYLGKFIHFKIKMPLPIGDFSWYFSKWQLAYFEYLYNIE